MIENEKILLRLLETKDIDFLYKWENDMSLWEYGDTRIPFSKALLENYISNYDANILSAKQLRFMIIEKSSNSAIGAVDLYDVDIYNSRAFIGIMIIPQWQNMGYALNIIGLSQIAAYIPSTNLKSISLFKRLGYTESGCLKNWSRFGNKVNDVIIMQHILNE